MLQQCSILDFGESGCAQQIGDFVVLVYNKKQKISLRVPNKNADSLIKIVLIVMIEIWYLMPYVRIRK